MLTNLWQAEPAMATAVGSAAAWPALFALLASFGVTLTPQQQQLIIAIGTILAGLLVRQSVTAPANLPGRIKPRP